MTTLTEGLAMVDKMQESIAAGTDVEDNQAALRMMADESGWRSVQYKASIASGIVLDHHEIDKWSTGLSDRILSTKPDTYGRRESHDVSPGSMRLEDVHDLGVLADLSENTEALQCLDCIYDHSRHPEVRNAAGKELGYWWIHRWADEHPYLATGIITVSAALGAAIALEVGLHYLR